MQADVCAPPRETHQSYDWEAALPGWQELRKAILNLWVTVLDGKQYSRTALYYFKLPVQLRAYRQEAPISKAAARVLVPVLPKYNTLDSIGKYLQRIPDSDYKTRCRTRWEHATKLLNRQVEANQNLAKAITAHAAFASVRQSGLEDDLLQLAYMGLIRAAQTFEPERGCRFSTYAAWWIRLAIRRGLQDCSMNTAMRLPAHQHARLQAVHKVSWEAENTGVTPENHIKRKLKLSDKAVEELRCVRRLNAAPVSLDDQINTSDNDDRTFQEIVPAENPEPTEICAQSELQGIVRDEIKKVVEDAAAVVRDAQREYRNAKTDRSKQMVFEKIEQELLRAKTEYAARVRACDIIYRRHGFDGRKEQTLEQIGQHYGVTRERIRQIESGIMKILRQRLARRKDLQELWRNR